MPPDKVQPSAEPVAPVVSYKGRAADRKALVDMQRTMFALSQDAKIPPHTRAQCARTWRDLQDTKRIMDGKPLPGMLRPDIAQEREAKRAGKRKGPSLLPMPELPSTIEKDPKESLSQP